jgi:hypothetical protein
MGLRKKKRIILGVGYPWYSEGVDFEGRKTGYWGSIKLYSNPNAFGFPQGTKIVELKNGNSGAWKKYKLIIEEL